MSISYNFAEKFIIMEFFLVFIILLLTILLKAYYAMVDKKKKILKNHIFHYLMKLIQNGKPFLQQDFPNQFKRIELLLESVQELDGSIHHTYWQEIRKEIISQIMLPMAKKATSSRFWENRLYAAQIFALMKQPGNDSFINILASDNIPVVYLYAWRSAIINESLPAIDTIVTRMKNETRTNQSLELAEIDWNRNVNRQIFENKLKESSDPVIRSIYYKILLRFHSSPLKWDISNDIHSNNKELKIAALKYISHAEPKSSVSYLIETLKDDDLDVKLVSLHRLAWMQAKEAVPFIVPLLKNSDSWVRISAAETLKNMGDEGEEALRKNDKILDKISFNLDYILNKWL